MLAAAWVGKAQAGDTTYGETRTMRKPPAPYVDMGIPGENDEESRVLSGYDYNSEGSRKDFFTACMQGNGEPEGLEEAIGYLLLIPFRLGICSLLDNFRASHVHLFTGSADMEGWKQRPWRLGLGFGLGALVTPGQAGGAPFHMHAEAVRALATGNLLRLQIGTFGSATAPVVDYQRTVYLDIP